METNAKRNYTSTAVSTFIYVIDCLCKDCKYYKLGYTFCDGFQCGLAITGSLELLGYVDPVAWKGGVCIHDERLKDLKKVK